MRTGRSRALGIRALSPSRALQCGHDDDLGGPPGPPSRSARWRATLRKQPSAFLLAVQILVILLLPFLESRDWGRAVISLPSLSAVITAVFTVRSTALTWLSATSPCRRPCSRCGASSTTVRSSPWRRTRRRRSSTSTRRTRSSRTCSRTTGHQGRAVRRRRCFTVLVFAFAYVFLAVQEIWPGLFTAYQGGATEFLELIYLSAANSRASACPTWS